MYETLLRNLRAKGYGAQVFSSEKEVVDYLADQIQNTTVAFGGSKTLEKLGLYERLSEKNHVSWHWRIPEGKTGTEVLKEARDAVVYVSSANAIATSGEIVNRREREPVRRDPLRSRTHLLCRGQKQDRERSQRRDVARKKHRRTPQRPPSALRNPVRKTRR